MATDDDRDTGSDSGSDGGSDTGSRRPTPRFRQLPERIRPEDMVEEQDTESTLPFDGGRNAPNEFVIRHLIG